MTTTNDVVNLPKRYNFYLREETIELLDSIANTERRSRSNMLEVIIHTYKKKKD